MATAAIVGDTGVKDIKGRTFGLPVDAEHKATACGPTTACLIKEPHMHSIYICALHPRPQPRRCPPLHPCAAPATRASNMFSLLAWHAP